LWARRFFCSCSVANGGNWDDIVSVDRVGFAYPKSNGDRPFVLEDVSFELKEGDLLGFSAPTARENPRLLRLLIKAITHGRVKFFGGNAA
jgi:ABC-type protease/lipase transport system fused ATPase/permease subunit